MKCIYCNCEAELTVSDIIPYALTGAKVKRRFVCKVHNSFTNDRYEKDFIKNLDYFRKSLGLTTRDGDEIKVNVSIDIGDYHINNVCFATVDSLLNGKQILTTSDNEGRTIKIGNRDIISRINSSKQGIIQEIETANIDIRIKHDMRQMFISDTSLHSIAKIAYEWHCYVNNIEAYDSQKYGKIVEYILGDNDDELVSVVTDPITLNALNDLSRTGTNIIFEYEDNSECQYVVISLWNVIAYKILIYKGILGKSNENKVVNMHCYHLDGEEQCLPCPFVGSLNVISHSPQKGLDLILDNVREKLSELGNRDITKMYIDNHIKEIDSYLECKDKSYKTLSQLLDYGEGESWLVLYILWKLSELKDLNYDSFTERVKKAIGSESYIQITEDEKCAFSEMLLNFEREGTLFECISKWVNNYHSI